MNKIIPFLLFLLIFGCSVQKSDDSKVLIGHLEAQLDYAVQMAEQLSTKKLISPRTSENGELKLVSSRDWTSGFFPGNLWMIYELSGNEKWKEKALQFTLPLEEEKWNGGTHDMGFKMYCSFGQAIKYTNVANYREILVQSAKTLATRFNPTVGCIRSWDHNSDKWDYPVIIDNMMNLELLLWAAKETGNDNFKEIAIIHAQTTLKDHFRKDNSSYHVIDYNPETGEVENKNTHQGYADESAWARGQAWGLYGFTMMYRETGMTEFLSQAEKIADFILNQPGIKEGKIPYWDFNAPNIPNEPYDASAGAIIASALFELSGFSNHKAIYLEVAQKLLTTLSSDEFLAPVGENAGFLLEHSTGHKPKDSEIDVPLVYADYYFLEAIIRNKQLLNDN
ncbi:glycoside hydrolase family 88 protein [Prolixibacteraceae bacterium Z1-6]|uniref:Glycoside hydrolase family 88 protein n=1 Tax=Draconibacterium aestuarii TaxID=2998507 RepID=A0A9X3J353_9BACT|nr:glycoside hydrolase family 88 protein [Prolixibacteraceae bacterium Z1-6]